MRRLYAEFLGGGRGLGLLVLRVVAGSAMAIHGWQKISKGMTTWGDGMGIPAPLQACAAIAEFGGGIGWVLGALMPLASLGLIITMAVATYKVAIVNQAPFVARPGESSYESAAGYLAVAVMFLVVGPGRLAVDSLLFGKGPVAEPDPARKLAH